MNHPQRVRDPKDAEIFVVPFAHYRSHKSRPCPKRDKPWEIDDQLNHPEKRSKWVMETIVKEKYWKIKGPRHFFILETWWNMGYWNARHIPTNFFCRDCVSALYVKMSMGLYMSGTTRINGFLCRDVTGCSFVSPWIAKPGLYMPDQDFETWNKRDNVLFWRYGARGMANKHGNSIRSIFRQESFSRSLPFKNIIVMSDQKQPTFRQDIHNSKFCIHVPGDDPGGHRPFDAMAAGCIVIIMADGFLPHFAPFTDFMPWDKFTISITDGEFLENPKILTQRINQVLHNQKRLKEMHHNMLLARRGMIFHHPQSVVVEYSLGSIARRCLNESAFYMMGQERIEYWRHPPGKKRIQEKEGTGDVRRRRSSSGKEKHHNLA